MSIDSNPFAGTAIDSILAQNSAAEIIAVNSGHGSLRSSLGDRLSRIVLVESPTKRLPGGTRNLGLAQAHAPIIAFLAADCIAGPGWIAGRLAGHRAGAEAVASTLLPAPDRNGRVPTPVLAMYAFLHSRRWPGADPDRAPRYGASYLRSTFDRIGIYREDLRVGEDTEFNARLPARPVWRGDVLTLQRYPATIAAVWADAVERGRLSYEWNRRRGRPALLQAMMRMVSGPGNVWRYFVASDTSTKWALLHAVPIVLLIALASGVGAVRAALS
jgi:hypothetical protein